MNKTSILLAAVMTAGLTAKADLVTFEPDSDGLVPNGWSPSESANISFYDTLGADNNVLSGFWEFAGSSRGLATFSDDTSALRMVFSQDYGSLSLVFGNDQAGFVDGNDWAYLTLWNNGNFVGSVGVTPNLNDLGDQTIAWSSGAFDEAYFQYVDENFNAVNLIEAVDNIEFGDPQAPVPEVQHYASMLGAVMAGAEMLRRRRNKA